MEDGGMSPEGAKLIEEIMSRKLDFVDKLKREAEAFDAEFQRTLQDLALAGGGKKVSPASPRKALEAKYPPPEKNIRKKNRNIQKSEKSSQPLYTINIIPHEISLDSNEQNHTQNENNSENNYTQNINHSQKTDTQNNSQKNHERYYCEQKLDFHKKQKNNETGKNLKRSHKLGEPLQQALIWDCQNTRKDQPSWDDFQMHITKTQNIKKRNIFSETPALLLLLTDLRILAQAALRDGRLENAAECFYKRGYVFDKLKQHKNSLKNNIKFLESSQELQNSQYIALAHNCVGVNHINLGQFQEAICHHNAQVFHADTQGKYVAHSNLGVAYDRLGLIEHAAVHYRHALDFASRLPSCEPRGTAAGNLGLCALKQQDEETASACLKVHSAVFKVTNGFHEAARHIREDMEKANANKTPDERRLGEAAAEHGDFLEAAQHFSKTLEEAKSSGDGMAQNAAKAAYGICMGKHTLEDGWQYIMPTGL